MSENKSGIGIGGDVKDGLVVSGNSNIINIIEQKLEHRESEAAPEKNSAVRYKKIVLIAVTVIIAALIVGVYLRTPKTPNISGKWAYHAHKDDRTWTITQKDSDITIREDSGNECIGHIENNSFSFSCNESMTSGAEPVRLAGNGKMNQAGNRIEGTWERDGLEGGFMLEKQ